MRNVLLLLLAACGPGFAPVKLVLDGQNYPSSSFDFVYATAAVNEGELSDGGRQWGWELGPIEGGVRSATPRAVSVGSKVSILVGTGNGNCEDTRSASALGFTATVAVASCVFSYTEP